MIRNAYKRKLQTVQDDWIDIIKYNNTDVK
jgi:hypothetical protein